MDVLFQGKNGLAARRMVEMMTEGPPLVAVLGPSLSPELTVVGQISPFYDIVHVSTLTHCSRETRKRVIGKQ